MAGLRRTNVSVSDAWARVAAGAVLLDVRTKDELGSGTPKGAVHIPFDALERRWERLGDVEVLVICRSGDRSRRGAAFLRRNGMRAFNVRGGMNAWEKAGLPTTRPRDARRR